MADPLLLRVGPARWLNRAPYAVVAAALLGLLTAGIDPLCSAGASTLLVGCAFAAIRWQRGRATRGRLHLARDGAAVLFTPRGLVQAWLGPGAWVSSALCVLELRETDTGRRRRCVVCRSLNKPASYRRLLSLLRHVPADAMAAGGVRT